MTPRTTTTRTNTATPVTATAATAALATAAPATGRHRRAGWFMIDALLAIGVITILSLALAQGMRAQSRAAERLATSRESMRLAEQTLVALQSRSDAPKPPQGVTIEIRPADPNGNAAEAPARWKWVTVVVSRDRRTTTLTGIAPAAAEGAVR